METKKFQGLKISHVKERLSTYRLQFNDNSILDLPKIELGQSIPKKGMFVRFRFYRSLILQRVEFDGKIVINRSMADIMAELYRIDDKLEDDVRKETGDSEDPLYEGLADIFKKRVDMLQYIPKVSEFQDYTLQSEVFAYEIASCYMAQKIAEMGQDYLNKFSDLSLREQQAVLQEDIEPLMINYIIELASTFLQQQEDEDITKVLNLPYCINLDKEEHEILIEAYLNSLK